jgi:hypothetical protein
MSDEINNHFEKTKAYTFRTDHVKKYTLVMTSDLIENETRLYLYVGEPLLYSFFGGLLKEDNEPVREGIAGPNTDIEKLVYKMVSDYEICLHHHDIVRHMDKELVIDHIEELRKRRSRFIKPEGTQEEQHRETRTINYEIPVDVWNAPKEEEDEKEKEVMEVANKNDMHVNSVSNLRQYRKKKLG